MTEKAWWKEAVVMQLYPASFKDSTGTGFGDLNGIRSKLDYLQSLGIDMLWLCPVYVSPMEDMGYDISNYQDIDPKYGTLADWDALVKDLHGRGMKLIMDLVINHTSNQHAWFLESRSSKDSPKRDWYYWRPAKFDEQGNRVPPNNWKSLFGDSAWSWDEKTQEYYLRIFAESQPDLNWESESMRKELYNSVLKFWLEKGTDGFRLDAINFISKKPGLPDAPISDPGDEYQPALSQFNHGPRIHEYLAEMHREIIDEYDVLTVGEAAMTSPEQAMLYVNQNRKDKELQMIFNTDHLDLYGGFETGEPQARDLTKLTRTLTRWQTFLHASSGCWNSVYGENHDHPRSVSRFMDDSDDFNRMKGAMALAMVWLSLCGTVYIYQGEELGMRNLPESVGIEEYRDVVTLYWYQEQYKVRKRASDHEPDMKPIMRGIRRTARDNARTPMPWDSTPHTAGFTTASKPWMIVNPDNVDGWNVADQEAKEKEGKENVLGFYRQMIGTRKAHKDVLVYGHFEPIGLASPLEHDIYCFIRKADDKRYLILINFSAYPHDLVVSSLVGKCKELELVIGNYRDAKKSADGVGKVELRAYEGLILNIKNR